MPVFIRRYTPRLIMVFAVALAGCGGPIPDTAGIRLAPFFEGSPAEPRPLAPKNVAPHPLLSPISSIHSDAYNSDVDDYAGPLGICPVVESTFIGMSPIIMFDSRGNLYTVSFDAESIGLGIAALDRHSLEVIDRFALPVDLKTVISGGQGSQGVSVNGAYYHIDHRGRAIVGTQDNVFLELALVPDAEGNRTWRITRSVDLNSYLPEDDFLIDAMPDWNGNIWFVSDAGVVGILSAENGSILTLNIEEFFENGLAVAEDGVYAISSEAAYRFEMNPATGAPRWTWRIPYDRGSVPKPGTFALGSGSTPTLLGDDLITFTDNADDRVNLLVYRRRPEVTQERLVASVPLFESGASAVDVSMIGYNDSIVVANIYNAGRFLDDYRGLAPGLTRIDVRPDRSACDVVWTAPIRSTTIAKLSTATGLIYTYTQALDVPDPTDIWYFTAIDFRTGNIVYRVRAGSGTLKNNAFGGIAIGPDGAVYQGVLGGLVRVRDSARAGIADRPPRLSDPARRERH
ncbi:MAG: PQQ-like beta-propeller repeat protein [Lentisphaerae bacterium]|nr:PQQ-like beta-propeller repeat protein [Lentisphaerota bacterium]